MVSPDSSHVELMISLTKIPSHVLEDLHLCFIIENKIVKLGVQELLSLGLLSSSTKDKLSRSPLDPGA